MVSSTSSSWLFYFHFLFFLAGSVINFFSIVLYYFYIIVFLVFFLLFYFYFYFFRVSTVSWQKTIYKYAEKAGIHFFFLHLHITFDKCLLFVSVFALASPTRPRYTFYHLIFYLYNILVVIILKIIINTHTHTLYPVQA